MLFSKKEREFRRAYSDYYPIVFNTLYLKLGNREDAEDICQEIFVGFYKKFDEIEDFKKWLFGSLKYGISNYYRKKGVSDSDKINIDDLQNDLNLAFENGFRDIRIIINEAIENKTNYNNEKEKIMFDLIAINDYTYEQTAKQLGLTKRQVEYRYIQITKRILNYLKDKGITRIEDLL